MFKERKYKQPSRWCFVDNYTTNSGSGGPTFASDDIGGTQHPRVKIQYGVDGSATDVSDTNPLPIDDAGGSITVDGTVTANLSATDNAVLDSIDTNTTTLAAAVTGTEMQVDIVSSAAIPVTDNAGSLTVDNTNLDNLHTADFDTGAGTDTTPAIGIAVAANGGAAVITGDVTNGLDVDVTRVSGTVTVDASGTAVPVTDNGGSLTVDNAALSVTGGGVEATALRVTIASDSTGVISVDDNAGSLTVDNAALSVTGGGVEASALRVTLANDSTGVLSVDDNGGSLTVDGTVGISGTVTVDLSTNNDVTVTGGNAHDGTTLGNPVLGGARATNSIEGVTQVANADLTYIQADLNGVLITRPHTTLEEIISERVSDTAGTSTAFTNFAAGGAGIHNYVTTISIFNSSATDGYVDFRDGTAGSIIFTAPAPAAGGSVINFPVPLKGAANTALAYDVSGALSTVYISVIGFQAQG